MAIAELHGRKMTPLEQGYAAFLRGVDIKQNPFEKENDPTPYSKACWVRGWEKAQREARRKSV